jgi:hypothetical protein
MWNMLQHGLHHRNPFIRKGSILLLQAPRRLARAKSRPDDYRRTPPVLANSFPKSGTHLLDQIVAGLPGRANYGAFLSSMTSSFQMRRRTPENACQFIARCVPGEIVRGHLFHDQQSAAALEEFNFAHYFIYRDPRDVVVSASHYLRHMNRWHRLSKRFRSLASDEDGVLLSIEGLPDDESRELLPSIAERFRWYEGWLDSPNVMPLRFEDLTDDGRDAKLVEAIDFYAARSVQPVDRAATLRAVLEAIDPHKSHTFRAGKQGGWRKAFTPQVTAAFKRVAGDLLIRLGYERDHSW